MRTLTDAIGRMPPFPEVVGTMAALKRAGFMFCIVSNTDDDIIGNVAQLGGSIDRVITAERAGAYMPSPLLQGSLREKDGRPPRASRSPLRHGADRFT